MRFASLFVSLAAGTVAFSMSLPTKRDGYFYFGTFHDLDAATQSVDDYLTYQLHATVQECQQACNSVSDCRFVNSYYDVNGKDGSTLLTCALFSECHGPKSATNEGGQMQPNGKLDYIKDSSGWCKINY